MFGIATSEYLLIIIVAVLVLGPEHLPKVLRTLAKLVTRFRRITIEVQRIINIENLKAESLLHATSNKPNKKNVKAKPQTNQTLHSSNTAQQTTDSQQFTISQKEVNVSQVTVSQEDTLKKQHTVTTLSNKDLRDSDVVISDTHDRKDIS